jgi:hypothetical protein
VRIAAAMRGSSLVMVFVTATGFAGAGGWTAGRTPEAVAVDDPAPAPAAAAAPSHAHHAHHAPETAARTETGARHHHNHDCENGICRCDSRCPPRRSGPCGGTMRSCSGGGQDTGLGPGPIRPFLLSAVAVLAPGFDRLDRLDTDSTPLTLAREPFSPPPRSSSL